MIKPLSYCLIIVLLFIIAKQYEKMASLESYLGNTYKTDIHDILNGTSSLEFPTDLHSEDNTELLLRTSINFSKYSENLSRIPYADGNWIWCADKLWQIASTIHTEKMDEDQITEINRVIYIIHLYFDYIYAHIPEDTREWYKEFNKRESKVLEDASKIVDEYKYKYNFER